MLTFLKRLYFTDTSVIFRLKHAIVFGVFVFLFLLVFRPFNIGAIGNKFLMACIGFGAVTFVAMVIMNILVPRLFRNFYSERSWTLGKEILQTLLNIILIGAFNFLFFSYYISGIFSWTSFLWFQFSAFAVGIIPVTIYLVLKEKSSREKYETDARELTGEIRQHQPNDLQDAEIVTFSSVGSKDELTIALQQIYYIRAADNYLDIYYSNGVVKRATIRNTLKIVQDMLQQKPFFMRCHRSYIVNLQKVFKISGNAQGYKLHLNGIEETVPVSRQYNDLIKERLTTHP